MQVRKKQNGRKKRRITPTKRREIHTGQREAASKDRLKSVSELEKKDKRN